MTLGADEHWQLIDIIREQARTLALNGQYDSQQIDRLLDPERNMSRRVRQFLTRI